MFTISLTSLDNLLPCILNGTDQSEETAALADLVEIGASLLNTVNYLLKDVHAVSKIVLQNGGLSAVTRHLRALCTYIHTGTITPNFED